MLQLFYGYCVIIMWCQFYGCSIAEKHVELTKCTFKIETKTEF